MTGLSASGYYYRPKRDPAERARRDTDLRDRIEAIQADFPRYGYRRLHRQLENTGVTVNEKRIRRVMRQYGLMPEIKRAYAQTNGPNEVWAADITYIRIATCFVYLAVVLDLFSRKVVGWALSTSLQHELALEALRMALEQRQPPEGCIHHSDRGVQYACDAYVKLLEANKLRISMSRRGNPYDNAFAESFMKTLKTEEVSLGEYESMADVVERIPYFIEEVYNKKRLHSSIGYLPPDEYEKQMLTKSAMACNPSPQL